MISNDLVTTAAVFIEHVSDDGLIEQPGTVTVRIDGEDLEAQVVVNCAGLHSDRVAKLGDNQAPAAIIPFRGEYYALKPEMHYVCRTLIYPVPDPQFPFLGVHFTRMIDSGVECGPNAVLAFARCNASCRRSQRSEGRGQRSEGQQSAVGGKWLRARLLC